VRRREFITLLGGTAAWPLAVCAQQPTVPVIGVLHSGDGMSPNAMADFTQGLSENGIVVGQGAIIEHRQARDQHDQLPALAADLVRRRVTVIYATGGIVSAQAAKTATATIPIVFSSGADPVALGVVASLGRPGANVTGVSFLQTALEAKRFELLQELMPTAAAIGLLINKENPAADRQLSDVETASRTLGRKLVLTNASSKGGFDAAFATLVREQRAPLVVTSDPFFFRQREQLVALAAQHRIPAVYEWREFSAIGGLMSYGASLKDSHRLAGTYVARILKGEKPAELPVLQPIKFELVINLKTAQVLGIAVPPTLLARADEVIE
jgi:putative tryptophan/tyrosine transport system substrate-binding protein